MNSLIILTMLILVSNIKSYDKIEAREDLIENVESITKLSYDDIEVPDSALLLLDHLNNSQTSVMAQYARAKESPKPVKKPAKKPVKKQRPVVVAANVASAAVTTTVVNTTTASSSSDEDDSDDDDDDEDDDDNESPAPSRRCVCELGVCKCCTGLIMDLLKQKACMKVAYHPGDFAFDVSMAFNDRVLYETSLSGKSPKPICLGPPRFPNIKVCAKFYDVFFPGRNFHFCLQMNGKFGNFDLFNINFECLRMGANGIAIMKPEDNGGITIPNPQGGVDAVIDSGEDDIEDYDENVKSLLDIFEDK